MPKFLCDYCDTHLNFDSQSGRKQHNRGRKHQENVRGYYAQYAAALAQANRDAAAAGMAPVTYGITLMPPSHTAGASLGASGGGGGRPVAQPFAPYPAPSRPPMGGGPPPHAGGGGGGFHSGPPAGGFHQGPPGGGFQGGYRGPPPPQMGGGMPQQQQQQQHQGFGQSGMGMGGRPAPGGPGLPPPPFMGAGGGAGGLPPPPMGGRPAGPPMAGQLPPPQQQQQQQAPAAAAAAAGGAASKPFVNPDRMRALGLMDHR